MKPNLILLTNSFPNATAFGESWLEDEMHITYSFYNKIYIFPPACSAQFVSLPANCEVIDVHRQEAPALSVGELLTCLSIVLSDFIAYPRKKDYFKTFRYNLSLVKSLYLTAKKISGKVPIDSNSIIYAYWADNLATTACMIRKMHPACKVVTRGHGFEIFEEQTKYGVIPFRRFQFKYLDRLFADSKRGMDYLNKKDHSHRGINASSYVGTKDRGMAAFDAAAVFSVATCSHVRSVKRLHLMPGILEHIDFELVWHVLGDGEDLDMIRQKNASLPANIKVIYHGSMSNSGILDFYKNTSVNLLVSLSYSEGLPVSMMEAQSFGIPIMSTDVGGCREICHEQTGFLIERDFDVKQVADKIKEFKDSVKNSYLFRQQCRQYWAENFNAEVNYANFANEIVSL